MSREETHEHRIQQRNGNGHYPSKDTLSHMSTEEIREEIEHTREDLDHTIDEIKHVTSPDRIAEYVVRAMKGGPGKFFAGLGRTVRDNPIPTTLTALGLIWMAVSTEDDDQDEERSFGGDGEGLRAAWQRFTGDGEGDVEGRGRERLEGAEERAHEIAAHARGKVRRARGRARDEFWSRVNESPLVIAAVGIAMGAAVGGSLPATSVEDRKMGRVGDEARRRLGTKAREGRERAREAGRRVTESTREHVRQVTREPRR